MCNSSCGRFGRWGPCCILGIGCVALVREERAQNHEKRQLDLRTPATCRRPEPQTHNLARYLPCSRPNGVQGLCESVCKRFSLGRVQLRAEVGGHTVDHCPCALHRPLITAPRRGTRFRGVCKPRRRFGGARRFSLASLASLAWLASCGAGGSSTSTHYLERHFVRITVRIHRHSMLVRTKAARTKKKRAQKIKGSTRLDPHPTTHTRAHAFLSLVAHWPS